MTRYGHLPLITAAWLLAGSSAQAQSTPFTGDVANLDCSAVVDNLATGGELVAVKLATNGGLPIYDDFLVDLRAKGGLALLGTDAGGVGYLVLGGNFRGAEAGDDIVWTYFTHANSAIAIDSGEVMASSGSLGVCMLQVVGNSLAIGHDAGIGLVLPGSASTYDVDLDGAGPALRTTFPFGLADAIQVAFAPLADLNNQPFGLGCTVGGDAPDPSTLAGHVVGYNVYRIPATGAATVPAPREFLGGWQHFIPFSPRDPNCGLTTCAGDDIGDHATFQALSGYRDNDGRPDSGDEIIVFHDGPLNGDGTPRVSGTPPNPLAPFGYWYAFQPVIGQGRGEIILDLNGVPLTSDGMPVITVWDGPDGGRIAADLDGDSTPDFYSPQGRIGSFIGGLGLTHGSVPLLSPPVLGMLNPMNQCFSTPVTGTCCLGTTCMELTAADCAMQLGTYGGDNTTCTPTSCAPDPTGTCCVGLNCSELTAAECALQLGAYGGDNTTCTATTCVSVPTGACCVGTSCAELTAAECVIQLGTYAGDNTACTPMSCGLEVRINDEVQRLIGIAPGDPGPDCGLYTAPTLDSLLATPCRSARVGCQPSFRIQHVRLAEPMSLPLRVAPPQILVLPGEAARGFETGVLTLYEAEGCDFQLFVRRAVGSTDLLLDVR